MKQNYDECLKRLLAHEGGYTNHPSDPGGPTNFGITIFDYRLYINKNGTADDVRHMTVDQAKAIYRSKYWDALHCDDLPSGVDNTVFDYGVNSGIGRAARVYAQLKTPNAKDTINAICDERMRFLRGLKTWPVFGAGWSRRVGEVRTFSLSIADKKDVIETAPPDKPIVIPPPPDIEPTEPGWLSILKTVLSLFVRK